MEDFEDPIYQISVVAELLGIHPQTLRHYRGVDCPIFRTSGKISLFQKDVEDLRLVMRLTRSG